MGYKHFNIQIIIRVLLLIAIITALIYFLLEREYIKSSFIFFVLLYQVIELISYVNKSNYDYVNFLNALANKDYTTTYSNLKKGKSFKELYQNFDKISNQFRTLNFERELQFQHLQTLVKHIDIGIISFDKENKIHLVNDAFKKIFNRPHLATNQQIQKLEFDFVQIILNLKQDESRLYQLLSNNQKLELSLNTIYYKFKNQTFKLISVKNIHSELDLKEQESYQKLIRVLTHEIMNTLSPIISLSGTINQSIKELVKEQNPIDNKTGDYLNEGIEAIQSRSEGLLRFTESYRKLLRIPQPKIKTIDPKEYFKKFNLLFKENIQNLHTKFLIQISEEITQLFIDPELFEQVLINIYKNAFEAFITEKPAKDERINQQTVPTIQTEVFKDGCGLAVIKITDNGCGMNAKSIEQAFIPFYTTKEEGSGIGLSLSKQIILLHRGSIILESEEGKGTALLIRLKS